MTGTTLQQLPTLASRATAVGGTTVPDDLGEIAFAGFVLRPAARTLHRAGALVDIGSRAFDLLHVLAAAQGSVVSKVEIVARVWPTTVVEESNLRYQVAVLRKVLGADRDLVKSVPGRGYLLAAGPARPRDVFRSLGEPRAALPAALTCLGPMLQSGHLIPSRLAETQDAYERLSQLLRVALDELWEMSHGNLGQRVRLSPQQLQSAD